MLTEEAIVEQIQADQEMMAVLTIIRDLDLADAWLAAGAVRNFIWNQLSGRPEFDGTTDMDLVFYDPEISYEETLQIEQELKRTYPQYAWEVKNQVYMHQHSPGTAPYHSACDAVSKYPEQCTALAVRLRKDGQLELFLPYGTKDIEDFIVQPTPHFLASPERLAVYTERMKKKDWQSKWPPLEVRFPK